MRADGRADDELRPISFQRHFNERPEGSVLVCYGNTKVLCTATVEDGVPPWMSSGGLGWVTAEYGMLPGSTASRKAREGRTGKSDSRALEISRFIGRCMRPVVDRKAIRDTTIWIDCDVLQADGGTRTAAVSGAYVALHDAVKALKLAAWPLRHSIAAVSAGVVKGRVVLDLNYEEDAKAEVDLNIAMTGEGKYVDVQGTAESQPYDDKALEEMLRLARLGVAEITTRQQMALESKE
jgi:ribonuclease PH